MRLRRVACLALATVALPLGGGGAASAATGEWTRAIGSTWWDSANWGDGSVPHQSNDEALFLDTIGSAATVTVDAPVSLGTLYIGNMAPLTFAGPGPLTLATSAGDAFVGVEAGNHAISTPVHLASSSVIHVLEPSVLTVSGPLSTGSGVEFAKVSSGALRVSGPQSYGAGTLFIAIEGQTTFETDAAGSAGAAGAPNLSINVENNAHVTFGASQHVASLKVGGAFQGEDVAPVARLAQNGGLVLWTPVLAVDETGTLDVADNALVVQATAETRGAVLEEVERLIASARSGGTSGTWSGRGITSSSAAAQPTLTQLAAFVNDKGDGTPLFETFHGTPVDANSVVVGYTYNGDANVDGRVNADDYFRIDSTFLEQPAAPTFAEGDFNYDRRVDADDYFLIDSAFLGQEEGTLRGMALKAVSVPEPGVAMVVVAGGAVMAMRRR
jgi:hypothetical protein